jgi:hypothetical protein
MPWMLHNFENLSRFSCDLEIRGEETYSLMFDQVGILSKSLLALSALEHLDPQMAKHVPLQITNLEEGHATRAEVAMEMSLHKVGLRVHQLNNTVLVFQPVGVIFEGIGHLSTLAV